MFKRLNTREHFQGSGIGLSIVELSVGKLNGKIELESEKGEKSQFIITIPK
jgi:signal transduction histidine kinase